MKGDAFSDAKRTLSLCVKHLPANSRFNVVDFGSGFDWMFPSSVKATETNQQFALAQIAKMSANFGGTELWKALKSICAYKKLTNSECQLYVLTGKYIPTFSFSHSFSRWIC